jgi:hypothetical protein
MAHVHVLATEIGERVVSTPGVERAAEYVAAQARQVGRYSLNFRDKMAPSS